MHNNCTQGTYTPDRCDWCGRFISFREAMFNHNVRLQSGTICEPEEYMWCDACAPKERQHEKQLHRSMERRRVGIV